MKALIRYLQMLMTWAFLGGVIMTLVEPSISRLLITAPKSFGMNCEPAADWSVMALIRGQLIGLVAGALLGIVSSLYFRAKGKAKVAAAPAPATAKKV